MIDGAEHARAFERMVAGATERLIIHSTFLSEERAQAVLPLLIKAAQRGVKVDITRVKTTSERALVASGSSEAAGAGK